RHLPVADNYFWRVYLRGHYTQQCCPEYLKRAGFERLKAGLADRVLARTCTVTEFLRVTPERISRFVLLDHMDWMSSYHPAALADEWAAIFERAAPGARAIFRSAHARPQYLDRATIAVPGGRRRVKERLRFHDRWARELTRQDRVQTYAGFHIADVLPE
ncbi:MAG: DUF3419 family protein, partial [Betaproteobacteria bacterium]